MAKCCKVSVQKGPVVARQPTMKSMTRAEINAEDKANNAIRRSGQELHLMTPKN